MARPDPAVPAAGFGDRLDIVVSRGVGDRVVGQMRLGPEHLDGTGEAHAGALLGFADELVARAAPLAGRGADATWSTLEARLTRLGTASAGVLEASCTPLPAGPVAGLWQTTIAQLGGAPVALVTHTLVLAPALPRAEVVPVLPPESAKGPRPSPADVKRQEIAEAACDVIAEKGFAGATIREIAAAAGLHVPTLYQYVASKDEVLELVYTWAMECLRTDVDAASRGCTTAREKLLATVRGIVRNGDRYRRQAGVMNRELKSLPDQARARVLSDYQAFLDRVADLVREGIDAGEFRDVEPAIIANMIEAICDVWPLRQFAVRRFGIDAFEREAVAFVENTLAPPDVTPSPSGRPR